MVSKVARGMGVVLGVLVGVAEDDRGGGRRYTFSIEKLSVLNVNNVSTEDVCAYRGYVQVSPIMCMCKYCRYV